MKTEQRVVFTFDEGSLARLEKVMQRGGFETWGAAITEALSAFDGLQSQVEDGFTEVIVRNPKTDQERVMKNPRIFLANFEASLSFRGDLTAVHKKAEVTP